MPVFDIVLLCIIAAFGLFGLWFGLVHTLGSLLGTVLGAYLASRYYAPMADWLIHTTGWGQNVSRVIMFIIAFIIINRLVGLAFWIIEKVLRIITGLPFMRSLNHLLGLALGLFEGAISLGLIIYFIERFPLSEHFMGWIAHSTVSPYLTKMASVLLPLLPEALKMLKSVVDYAENTVQLFK